MGNVASKNSATGVLVSDLSVAVTNSAAMGGTAAALAGESIVPVHEVVIEVESELEEAKKVAAPLIAAASVAHAKAVDFVQLTHDLTWNTIGRPKNDAKFALLFPSGASHYIVGEAEKLPDRMEILANLFDRGIHPKLTKAQNQEAAGKLRLEASAYRDTLKAANMPTVKVTQLERTWTAMGQTAQFALANYKRLLKVAGFTEAQIHAIIPDRPEHAAKKAASKKRAAAKLAKNAQPGAAQPGSAQAATTQAGNAQPGTTQPANTQPANAQPGNAQPGNAQPGNAQPGNAQPASAQPASAQPANTQPANTQPANTQPANTQPASAQPANTQPANTQPANTQPGSAQPGNTQPAASPPPAAPPSAPKSPAEETRA